MDGARALMRTLVESGVTTLFANPGTTELHMVEAAEATPGLRRVLALFEGVVSGAADGYGRIAGRPAATLLHLGPGQGNAWANFHNARRARTPVVSLIGDHATYHKRFDPPLESDILAVAGALDSAVRTPLIAEQVKFLRGIGCSRRGVGARTHLHRHHARGRVLVADRDDRRSDAVIAGEHRAGGAHRAHRCPARPGHAGSAAARRRRLREDGLRAASQIATATGIRVSS